MWALKFAHHWNMSAKSVEILFIDLAVQLCLPPKCFTPQWGPSILILNSDAGHHCQCLIKLQGYNKHLQGLNITLKLWKQDLFLYFPCWPRTMTYPCFINTVRVTTTHGPSPTTYRLHLHKYTQIYTQYILLLRGQQSPVQLITRITPILLVLIQLQDYSSHYS